MSDEHEPGSLGDALFSFLREIVGEEQTEALRDAVQGGEDPFETIRDAVTAALGELAGGLDQLGTSLSDVVAGATEQLSGLAAAIGGAGSVEDAIERVMSQFNDLADAQPGSEGESGFDVAQPESWEDLGIALDDDELSGSDEL